MAGVISLNGRYHYGYITPERTCLKEMRTEAQKRANARWRKTEGGKNWQRRYAKSSLGKAAHQRYRDSDVGRETKRRCYYKQAYKHLLRYRGDKMRVLAFDPDSSTKLLVQVNGEVVSLKASVARKIVKKIITNYPRLLLAVN